MTRDDRESHADPTIGGDPAQAPREHHLAVSTRAHSGSSGERGRCRLTAVTDAPNASIGVVDEHEVYAAVGEDGFRRLVAAFYRQVPDDDILGPMYPKEDMEGAEDRLRNFLIFRFGGPQHYIEQRGHPRLRMRHAPFAVGPAARNRWVQLMDRAFAETKLPTEAEAVLRGFFESMATFMMNRRD